MYKKLFRKLISFMMILLVLVSSLPLNLVIAAVGDSEDNPIKYNINDTTNFPQYPNEGYVRTGKKAEWVDGEEDVAKVTMTLDGKGVQKTTDVVLVIDKSGSMNYEINTPYKEVALTFNVKKSINYQSNNKSSGGNWSNRNSDYASISLTAYIDLDGNFKGYNSNSSINVTGLSVSGASRYSLNNGSSAFNVWELIANNNCANALLQIFEGSKATGIIDGKSYNVTFPSSKNVLQNTNRNITTTKISEAKLAASKFVKSLLVDSINKDLNRIALVTYAGSANINLGLSNNTAALNNAINAISATGGTHIQAGISQAQEILSSSNAYNKYIVVLSDGEPTYSYKAIDAELTDDSDLLLNYPSKTSTGNNLGYKLTSFSSEVLGSGSSYTYSSYYAGGYWEDYWVEGYWVTFLGVKLRWVDGYWDQRWVAQYEVKDNGLPTISQALSAKKMGIELYSVGFDVSDNSNAKYVMEHIASKKDNYYLTTDDLSGVFSNIAGRIAKAGTNSKVNGTIVANDSLGYKFTILNDINHPIIANPGTATATSNSISWNLGDITESMATLTYYIKLNVTGDKPIPDNTMLDTGGISSVVYKNHNEKWVSQRFPTTKLSAGEGTINVSYFLANKNGQPVNDEGIVIPFENRIIIEGSELIESVDIGQKISIATYAKPIYRYINQSTTAFDENGNVTSNEITVTRATIYLNFPYYNERTFNVTYNGNGNTNGTVPMDNNNYYEKDTVRVAHRGDLLKPGFAFLGWSTNKYAKEAQYTTGSDFSMPSENVTLYAVWSQSLYNLTINYKYKNGEIFDSYTDALEVGKAYSINSPVVKGWSADKLTVSGTMPEGDITVTVIYDKVENKLINHSMYPNKGLIPIGTGNMNFNIVTGFDYTFGFRFEAYEDSPEFSITLTGNEENKYILNNFKLYEGNTLVSSADTLSKLNKDKIEYGQTYTITYRLYCENIGVGLAIKVYNDNLVVKAGVSDTINIMSNSMPFIE